jgi:6-methylpretetramide 4-monooxygenase / 4-hydroxy-6-methylpretetramide 12a-monooxygenase
VHSHSTEVLIIGAGPTGLFAAAELARHGVQAVIIDQGLEPHTQTRATCVEPFLEFGERVRGLRVWNDALQEAFTFRPPPPDSPYPFTCSIPQWRTEQILNNHLESFGIRVERGVTAREITLQPRGASVRCETTDGRDLVIETEYLIGAGGAHSPVRGAIHQRLEGITYPRKFLAADARTTLPRGAELLNMIFSPAGLLMVADLPEGRSLLALDVPDELDLEQPTASDLEEALANHLSAPFPMEDVRWISCYKTHRRMSPKFREGRCFLAGDAAHLCSPFGGEGMNSGLFDAACLAWQLACVLRRGGRPALLDAYEPERQDVAREVLASSDSISEFYFALVDLVRQGLPLEPSPPDPNKRGTSTHMLDVTMCGSPLLGIHGPPSALTYLRPGTRFPGRTRLSGVHHHLLVPGAFRPDAAFADRWRDILEILPSDSSGWPNDQGFALIRPDGYVGFLSTAFDDNALAALDDHLLSQFTPRG